MRFWTICIKYIPVQKQCQDFEHIYLMNEKLEEDADNFATNYLIPVSAFRRFSPTKYTSDAEIIAFAKSIGVHPGIVAGRLQHEGILLPNRCSKFKEKYDIKINHTA